MKGCVHKKYINFTLQFCYRIGCTISGRYIKCFSVEEPMSAHLSSMTDIANMFSVDDYMYFYSDYLTAERSDTETAQVLHLLQMEHPMRVLDLACGFGRIANRLALLGHRVTGVEYQPGFLEIAQAEAAREPYAHRAPGRQSGVCPGGYARHRRPGASSTGP